MIVTHTRGRAAEGTVVGPGPGRGAEIASVSLVLIQCRSPEPQGQGKQCVHRYETTNRRDTSSSMLTSSGAQGGLEQHEGGTQNCESCDRREEAKES